MLLNCTDYRRRLFKSKTGTSRIPGRSSSLHVPNTLLGRSGMATTLHGESWAKLLDDLTYRSTNGVSFRAALPCGACRYRLVDDKGERTTFIRSSTSSGRTPTARRMNPLLKGMGNTLRKRPSMALCWLST